MDAWIGWVDALILLAMKRIFAMVACAVVLVATAATPAAAHTASFTSPSPIGWNRNIICPHPYLVHPSYGPMSMCTFGTEGVIENRAVGLYSPITNRFNGGDELPFYNTSTLERNVVATDGVTGKFRGGFGVDVPGFGPVSYGVQYIYYLTKPIGRFGNYSYITGKFHPDATGWLHVEAKHGI